MRNKRRPLPLQFPTLCLPMTLSQAGGHGWHGHWSRQGQWAFQGDFKGDGREESVMTCALLGLKWGRFAQSQSHSLVLTVESSGKTESRRLGTSKDAGATGRWQVCHSTALGAPLRMFDRCLLPQRNFLPGIRSSPLPPIYPLTAFGKADTLPFHLIEG